MAGIYVECLPVGAFQENCYLVVNAETRGCLIVGPGAACLYNVDIMEETTSILAMGAGAISKRVLPDRELRIRRAPNVTNVSVYIDRAEEMARRKEILFTQTEGEKPCES